MVGTRLQSHSGQRKNKSFVRLEYRIPLKVDHSAWKTRSRASLVKMIADSWSLQTLLEWLKMLRISTLRRRLINSSRNAKKTEEHWGHTRAISSIASWKEGFTEYIHMYKMCGRDDKDAEFANNDEEQFATQFFNFMRKYPDIVIS
jgi:hypothetical protein